MKTNRNLPAVPEITRRQALTTLAAAGIAAGVPRDLLGAPAASSRAGADRVIAWLETLARQDHGYAWPDQADSHLTPTYAALGCYHLLGKTPPGGAALAEFVRTHHPSHLGKLEQEHRVFDFQQVQSLRWLGDEAADFRARIAGWTKPITYKKQYERHEYPVFQYELGVVFCYPLLGMPVGPIAKVFGEYVSSRRRANGTFNNTPAADGGDGHVMNTLWGLQASRTLGLADQRPDETIRWLRDCQLPGGGFTYQPNPPFGGLDDVAYTRAAVRALAILGAGPSNRDGCLAYLRSLANPDGGFGDRPGWESNANAAYCALDALDALGALDVLDEIEAARRSAPPRPRRPALPDGLKVFTMQVEAHGQGSPAEAVDLARALRIDMWGAKNADPRWMARVRAVAAESKVPVSFSVANEEYGTWVDVPGLGTYSHTADVLAPKEGTFGPSLAPEGAVSWPDFRSRRLAPLEKADGRLIWQFGENEEIVRVFLDDSVMRGGYVGISTFHFGNPDFTNTEPFLNRWRGQIPFIGLQDTHGPESWWFADKTEGFRTVFLAREPSWEGWLKALSNNWIVAIRHDSVSGMETWMHGGSTEVVDFVRQREMDWRWWDNPAIQRPLVSLVAIKPEDEFEVGRPAKGVALRVRCAWQCTPQAVLVSPLAKFESLTLDGVKVSAIRAERKRSKGKGLDDEHWIYPAPDIAPGPHTAIATVRRAADGREISRTIQFHV